MRVRTNFIMLSLFMASTSLIFAQVNTGKTMFSKGISPAKNLPFKDFSQLTAKQMSDLPALTVDRNGLLSAKTVPTKHWEITPNKLSDKGLKVDEYFGEYKANREYLSHYPEILWYPDLDRGKPGFKPESKDLVLSIPAIMGKRYRVRILLKPGDYRDKKVITYVSSGNWNAWTVNDQYDEILFDFEATSKTLKITQLIGRYVDYYAVLEPLEIKKILIDLIDET